MNKLPLHSGIGGYLRRQRKERHVRVARLVKDAGLSVLMVRLLEQNSPPLAFKSSGEPSLQAKQSARASPLGRLPRPFSLIRSSRSATSAEVEHVPDRQESRHRRHDCRGRDLRRLVHAVGYDPDRAPLNLPVSPKGTETCHPPFPLPRKGEGTEGERGKRNSGCREAAFRLPTPLPHSPPHSSSFGGECEQKPSWRERSDPATADRSAAGMNGARIRATGVAVAGPRPAPAGGKGPQAVRVADRSEAEPGSTRPPGWRGAEETR